MLLLFYLINLFICLQLHRVVQSINHYLNFLTACLLGYDSGDTSDITCNICCYNERASKIVISQFDFDNNTHLGVNTTNNITKGGKWW